MVFIINNIVLIDFKQLNLAYFANSTSVDNLFNTQPYGTTVIEEFTSPSDWLPGDTTSKVLTATNTGNVDEAVRIRLNESWKTANNGTLNGWIHADGSKSTHTTNDELTTDERVAIINFDNLSDWTYSNGYYYYNYKLAPNETTSSLIKSVTFNPKTKLDDTCVTTTNGSTKTVTCNSSGLDYDNATYTLTFNIETVQYNKYQEAWNTNFAIASEKPSSGVDYLLLNEINVDGAAYNDQTKSKMFKMSHPATDQTPAQTEYRYIGDNPYNYVYFNCDSLDNQNSNTCEVWRIIGVFDVDDGPGNYEQRIKLVRGSALPDTNQWDTRTNEKGGTGKNEWVGSVMQLFLNGVEDYYNRSGSASNYGLKATAKSLISNAKYYLGGMSGGWPDGYGTADEIYSKERGTEVYNQNNATRVIYWNEKVALLYHSDYVYTYANGVDNTCYNNSYGCSEYEPWGALKTENIGYPQSGWIYNSNKLEGQDNIYDIWLISPDIVYPNRVFSINAKGQVYSSEVDFDYYGVRPVLYLSSNVKITDGTGEQNNPYKLGL